MISYYELDIAIKEGIKKIRIVAGSTDWVKYESRIERELFGGKASVKYTIKAHRVIKEKLGLQNSI